MATMKPILIGGEFEAHAAASIFPPMSEREYVELVEDIRANGLREAIWLDKDGLILDGRHRSRACREAGVAIETRTYHGDDPVGFVVSMNLHRRHLNESQRAMVAARLASLERGDNQHTSIEGSSVEAAAERLSVGHASVERAKSVQRTGTQELQAKVDAGTVSVSAAADVATLSPEEQDEVVARGEKEILAKAKEIRTEKQEERRNKKLGLADRIRNEPVPLPIGPFRVIAIDPPWRYENRADDESHRGRNQYPDMSVDEICDLPVGDLAHDDCVLFLWTTNAFMRDAFRCLDTWGFSHKTIITWDKVNFGLGDWLRNVTEHCILAVKGKPLVTLTNQTTIVREKRREHSRKPEAFYDLVDSLCPGSKIELFARSTREGWQSWGAEVDVFNE